MRTLLQIVTLPFVIASWIWYRIKHGEWPKQDA